MKNNYKILILGFLVALFLMPVVSYGAEIFFTSDKSTFDLKEEFLVQVYIDTKDVNVNAIEGQVIFQAGAVDLQEIRDGNSVVNFWIERPHTAGEGKIAFSGITTGGFSGPKAFLFGMVFKSQKSGLHVVDLKDLKVLLNDGKGTGAATRSIPFEFTVTKNESNGLPAGETGDIEPPEDFTPFIASDPSIFDGKNFVVFSTVDKGSGVHHYEVREGIWGDYAVAESPYLLKDQTLGNDIYIKVFDKAGNKRIAIISAPKPTYIFEKSSIIGIILFICFLILQRIRRGSRSL